MAKSKVGHEIQQCKEYTPKKMEYPTIGQVKENGIFGRYDHERCKFFTRSGNVIQGLSHIESVLTNFPYSFDCEIVIPCTDFFIANGLIRSFAETPTAIAFVFDIVVNRIKFKDRLKFYTDKLSFFLSHIRPLPGIEITNEGEADLFYVTATKGEGKEGVVYKKASGFYRDGKHWNVQKRVPVLSAECEVVGVVEGNKSFQGMAGALIVDFNGVHVKVGGGKGVTFEVRQWLWDNRESIIGDEVTLSYKSVTANGSMQSPKLEGIRWDI